MKKKKINLPRTKREKGDKKESKLVSTGKRKNSVR